MCCTAEWGVAAAHCCVMLDAIELLELTGILAQLLLELCVVSSVTSVGFAQSPLSALELAAVLLFPLLPFSPCPG